VTLLTQPTPGPDAPADQAPPDETSPGMLGWLRAHRPRRRTMIGWAVYLVLLALYISKFGVPFLEDDLLLWVTGAVFVSCLGDLGRFRRGFVRDWLPLYIVLGLYALLRGYADHLLFNTHIAPQLHFDEWISAGVAPTVRLQRAFFRPNDLHVWDYLATAVYISHFFMSFVLAGVLWVRDHKAFRRFMGLYVTLMLSGFLTYVLYPAMPPWMASKTGWMPDSTRIVPVVFSHMGIHWAAAVFETGSKFNNDVAAVPSLHAACPMLICLFFYPRVNRRWLKALLVAYVPAMALALIYTGEHFFFDIVIGWIYAIVVFYAGSWVADRWAQRREAKAVASEACEPSASSPVSTSIGDGSSRASTSST
jgi:hypothetical protein